MSSKNLTQTVTNLVNKLTKSNSNSTKPKRQRKNKRNRNARRVQYPQPTRGILAGYGGAVTSSFVMNRQSDSCIVTGFDLVPYTAPTHYYISYFMPVNPIAWAGTRVAAIASGYQNYRPISIKIHYRPQVGSTDQKSLFLGTLWQQNTINAAASIEASLLTSAGGTYVPSWQTVSSVVPCGNRLPQRMYPVRDPDSSVVPFYIVARSSDAGSTGAAVPMPGRIFIEYTFQFHNAIGVSSGYSDWNVATSNADTQTTSANAALYTGVVTDTDTPSQIPIGSHVSWDRSIDSTGNDIFYPEVNGHDRTFASYNYNVGRYGSPSY